MRTLVCHKTTEELLALVRQLEDIGGNTNHWPRSIAVKSTTGKPLLNALQCDKEDWSVQVACGVAQAFDLKVWR